MELHADEPMPASIGWHPYFIRHIADVAGALELDFEPGAMYLRDATGIATTELVPPPPGPWDDCFTDLRRPPVLRWPGFLELTIESDCPDWVVYTVPEDTVSVEPQSAPPDALNTDPTVVQPGHPLAAEMTWRWRSLGGPS
jgi:aldose 1-epimerase